ncbi:hypothetical protein [Cellulomonas sp. SLBN-39]|uniref:hypothetical protein n=1 Tax=Cellulomonas sp. SLBN-39 TaxID=2768446 RepID=UPI0011515428|nr:hypothetical protein [Cellulomonas sp. SLBN-39]TQL02663.1 hypothetical protein FBY24_1743 [Cellulomonas sp. SLBN-39]
MASVEAAERRVDELRALLSAVRAARADVPSLRRATSAVGAPGSWTGTAAHRLHHDELIPVGAQLDAGLERAEQAVLDDLQHAERALGRAQDEQDAERRAGR